MSSEGGMQQDVLKWLKELDAMSVFNPLRPGTPDVNCSLCWLELKSVANWPKRADTILRLDHYVPQQRVWHVRRARVGGKVFVLLKVAQDWILLDGMDAAKELGKVTRSRIEQLAVAWWTHAPSKELLPFLKSICSSTRSCTCGDAEKS